MCIEMAYRAVSMLTPSNFPPCKRSHFALIAIDIFSILCYLIPEHLRNKTHFAPFWAYFLPYLVFLT